MSLGQGWRLEAFQLLILLPRSILHCLRLRACFSPLSSSQCQCLTRLFYLKSHLPTSYIGAELLGKLTPVLS
jgi:hypothetical protein